LVVDFVLYTEDDAVYLSAISDTCRTKVDVLFLLDGSGSMAQSGYDLEKEFVKATLAHFDVAEDETRVAAISVRPRAASMPCPWMRAPPPAARGPF